LEFDLVAVEAKAYRPDVDHDHDLGLGRDSTRYNRDIGHDIRSGTSKYCC
jgi:hypothetical protein